VQRAEREHQALDGGARWRGQERLVVQLELGAGERDEGRVEGASDRSELFGALSGRVGAEGSSADDARSGLVVAGERLQLSQEAEAARQVAQHR
jgi:hypothetical protein